MPVTEATRVFEGFVASYDYRTRNPAWVLEHLTPEKSNATEGDRWGALEMEVGRARMGAHAGSGGCSRGW